MKNLIPLLMAMFSLGFSRPSHIQYSKDPNHKYWVSDTSGVMELRDYLDLKVKREKDQYHNLSKRGYDVFQKCDEHDSLKTLLTFDLPYGVMGTEDYVGSMAGWYGKKFNIEGVKVGERTYQYLLTKHQIEKLIGDDLISDIDVDDGSKVMAKGLSDFSNQYQTQPQPDNGSTNAAVNAWYFTNSGYSGYGVNVSIMEPQPMIPSYLSSYFNFPNYNIRPNPYTNYNKHAGLVSFLIHSNDPINNTIYFRAGGSYNNIIWLSYPRFGESNFLPAYDWASQGVALVNHSYEITSGTSDINTNSRYLDIESMNGTRPLQIMSSGNNSGQVVWNCHNCLIVGNVWSDRGLNTTSSWQNRSSGDEVPHVTACGSGLNFPDGTTLQNGTSWSAAVITSLASDALSRFSHYNGYPEVLKAAIMTSAIGRNGTQAGFDPWTDTKVGFGVPNGEFLYGISANRFYSSAFSYSGLQGVADILLNSTSYGSGSSITKTLTVPSVSGTKKLNLVLTSFNNPEGTCIAGNDCVYDDVDLVVYDSNGTQLGVSNTGTKTTEYVKIDHSAAKTYTIKINMYHKATNKDNNSALAWRVTDN